MRTIILFIALLFVGEAFAENNYGLIYRNDPSMGQTSFSVTDGDNMVIQDSMRLDFKFSIYSHRARFGYISRLIFNNKTTLNFIVTLSNPGQLSFTLVNDGNVLAESIINRDNNKAYTWNDVSLCVTPSSDSIQLNINGNVTNHKLSLPDNSSVQILFGANSVDGFAVNDLPPIILRDLELKCGKAHKLWRMQSNSGDVVTDEINGSQLTVINPLWESDLHSSWVLEKEIVRDSRIYPVYNGSNKLHIISKDGVSDYNLALNKTIEHKFTTPIALSNSSNQFIYDQNSKTIRYFDSNPFGEFHSTLDNNNMEWVPSINRKSEASYQQSNIFVSPIAGELVQLFGYGFFRYKSTMFSTTSDGVSNQFELESVRPRYLASTSLAGDWCYVYGGGF